MLLELSRYIEGDLDNIADYIGKDNPRRVVTFIQDIRTKFFDIQRNPLLFQIRTDIGEEARMATVGNYVILYRVMGEIVRIERIVYGSRNLPKIYGESPGLLAPATGGFA